MVRERRAPGVKHGGDANARAKMARVGGDGEHRLRRRAEQQVVHLRLVLQGNVSEFGGNAKDDVEIPDRQQIGLARGQPFARLGSLAFWAMPVAAANGRRPLPALWAKPVMGSWRQFVCDPAPVAASSAHHYEARFSIAINLSVGWKTPRRRCGGTIASIASSFSVGSPRV